MSNKLVPAVVKTIQILELFSKNSNSQLSVSKIASTLSFSKGTTFSILNTLVSLGWLEKDSINSKYLLSESMLNIGDYYLTSNRTISEFLIMGTEMSKECNELINLHFSHGLYSAILVASIPATIHSLRVDLPLGTMIPVVPSSAGKCLISNQNDDTLRNIYRANKHVDNLILDEDNFIATIHKIRHDGYALNMAEYEKGIFSVGAPICNTLGSIIAAINIVVPEARFTLDRKKYLIELVKTGAKELSGLCN